MSSLSVRLTEPVVPLRCTSERTSRHHDSEPLPPAIVRGLVTLKLAKPTKISSIDLELQAKATTNYIHGAGPGRIDVTEEYDLHSASTVLFKACLLSQERRRAISTRPRVQFIHDHTGPSAQHGPRVNSIGAGQWQVPHPHGVTRSASVDPHWERRRSTSDELQVNYATGSRPSQIPADPAPPYPSSVNLLSVDTSVVTGSGIAEPQSPPSRISVTTDVAYRSPTSPTSSAHSRTPSIEEASEDESESSDVPATGPDNVAYYGLSRMANSPSLERDNRGRSNSRFSLGRVVHVFEAVKERVRSRSPQPKPQDREERGRSLTKGFGQVQVSTRGVQIGGDEPLVDDGVHDQSGDGWVMFPEGTYIYPVFFTIPNNSPPTMKVEHGSLIWGVKAEVKRPGVFTPNMGAQKEVIVVCAPTDDNSEEVEEVDVQQQWEGQLQYRVQLARRSIPVGGKTPFQLTIMPLKKVKVHSILAYLEERTEYYTRTQTRVRSDPIRRTTLLAIKSNHSNERHSKPILPLTSDEPDAFRRSPLHCFLRPGQDESEAASSFMGPGPWTIRHELEMPDSCSILHPSNHAKRSNVMVSHTLRLMLRIEKEEGSETTRRKRLYDIVIHVPIQILSCRCTSELTSLPGYDEALRSDGDSLEDTSTCPCQSRRRAKAQIHGHMHIATRPASNSSPASGALDTNPLDSPANHTYLHERLISGMVSERGEEPPSYERFDAIYE